VPLSDTAKAVRRKVAKCRRCPLSEHTRPVGWSGPTPLKPPRIAVLGEAPGQVEAETGRPFAGPSGLLLRRMMIECGLEPERMGWLNAAQCRPGALNADPSEGTLQACALNVNMILAVLQPDFLLLVGRIALQRFRPEAKLAYAHGRPFALGKARGRWRIGVPVYHPAALLHGGKGMWDLEAKMRADLRELAKLVRVRPGMRWPETCEVCGRDVDVYTEQGVAFCWKDLPKVAVEQPALFAG